MSALRPFRLTPTFRERPWGVRSLAPWFETASAEPIGEAWFTARDNPTSLGRTLGEVVDVEPDAVLGTGAFPGREALLLKFLFTAARLSVQVHPDDAYARRHHGSAGKTEAWHILSARPPAELGLGFTRELEPDAARAAARSGEIEDLVAWRTAAPGDTFLVPAGTVHAIGGGLTLVEVQEPSDVTYRLYDYGRPRELHLDHGFTVADLGPYTRTNARTGLRPGREVLTSCTHFTMERLDVAGSLAFEGGTSHYHLVIVIDGVGALDGHSFSPGDVFLAPAATGRFDMVARRATAVVAYTSEMPSRAFR
jgi:mannose-6-phosphate isomerase